MDNPTPTLNLPAEIAEAVVKIPKGFVPASAKALDRLVGAAVDIPVAWLAQHKAKIDAQTEAYKLVEASIAKAAAKEAGADEATVQRAVEVLVRKAYRKQTNREAVAAVMLEDLSQPNSNGGAQSSDSSVNLDEDWLNVFERYAEDASTERMQGLWGRVLAGEVRKPGRYSIRTLRFLSEFSQADGLDFAQFSKSAFGDVAPAKLANPEGSDIRSLIYLESNGLIQRGGLGLERALTFNDQGVSFIVEGNLAIVFKGAPNMIFKDQVVALTPLGQELLSLLPGRDAREAARTVALAMRTDQLEAAYVGHVSNPGGQVTFMEILWQKPAQTTEAQ